MNTIPDGNEVVATAAEAELLDLPPLLILDHVSAFLDGHGIGEGALAWQRIGDGQSNITYLITRGSKQVVLRRGPRPPLPRSTHDMLRETRVQQGLSSVGIPVPNILAVCEDESVLGVPFYVMDYLDGEIITDNLPQQFDTDDRKRNLSEQLIDTLIELHSVDLKEADLEQFGRPEGYLERQVNTFTSLSKQVSERELPLIEELSSWLTTNMPESQRHSLVHGDYRFGNIMFAHNTTPSVLAILDWEMASLGDPLADLGYLAATYTDANSPGTVMEFTHVTRTSGFLTSTELAERYARGTGLDISDLPWYQTIALWKSSVFLEAIYTRWKRGEREGDDYAASLGVGIPHLLESAQALTKQL